jgi:hypothetical protein
VSIDIFQKHLPEAEKVAEWILLLWLVERLFTASVIFASLFLIGEHLVGSIDFLKLGESFFVTWVLVGMVL